MDYPKSVPNVGLVNGKFVDENTTTGQVGSLIPAAWGSAVTDELLAVIRGAGIEPSEAAHDQLLEALRAIISMAIPASPDLATEAIAGVVKLISNDLMAAGVDDTAAITLKKLVGKLVAQGYTAFVTGGTAAAFTLTPVPELSGYAANQRFRVKFNRAGAGATTLNVSGRGAKNLKQYDATGSKVDAVLAAGQLADVEYDGADMVVLTPLPVAAISDPWEIQPIGVPIPLFTHMGATEPPTNKGYRYIKLTAADAYNAGALTSESVTGSAPLVLATAIISQVGSPLAGMVVSLINTERRVLRAGSSGTLEHDQGQGHRHGLTPNSSWAPSPGAVAGGGSIGYFKSLDTLDPIADGTNGAPRIGIETRAKNIGATYFMRIK